MVNNPRDPILDAAAEVFAEAGFEGARVDEIARRAGVNKAMLYYRVGNKDELYAAVLRRVLDYARANLGHILSEPAEPEQRLRKVCHAIAALASEMPSLPTVLLREMSSGGRNISDALLREMASLFAGVAGLYAEGERAGRFHPLDPVVAHMVTVSGLMLLVSSRPFRERLRGMAGVPVPAEPSTVAELADRFADLLLEGVRSRSGDPR